LVGGRSHPAGVHAFMSKWGGRLRGQFEATADSAEVHHHPRRWRSLSALRQSDANQGIRWPEGRRTPCIFVHALVLLHERDVQNDIGDARTLQDGVVAGIGARLIDLRIVCRKTEKSLRPLTRLPQGIPSSSTKSMQPCLPSRQGSAVVIEQTNNLSSLFRFAEQSLV
jgi:hypothetical protein